MEKWAFAGDPARTQAFNQGMAIFLKEAYENCAKIEKATGVNPRIPERLFAKLPLIIKGAQTTLDPDAVNEAIQQSQQEFDLGLEDLKNSPGGFDVTQTDQIPADGGGGGEGGGIWDSLTGTVEENPNLMRTILGAVLMSMLGGGASKMFGGGFGTGAALGGLGGGALAYFLPQLLKYFQGAGGGGEG